METAAIGLVLAIPVLVMPALLLWYVNARGLVASIAKRKGSIADGHKTDGS